MKKLFRYAGIAISLALVTAPICTAMETTDQVDISTIKSWHDLKSSATIAKGVFFYTFKTGNGSAASLVVVDTKHAAARFRPVVNTPTTTTSVKAGLERAFAAVNAGYFNLSNGESISYIIESGNVLCDPHGNPALMTNTKLHQYIDQIVNRTEVRFLRMKNGKSSITICRHNEPIPKDIESYDSIQAGPELLPELTDRDEAFVRKESDGKDVDSIGCHLPAARTAFGTTPDGHAMMICIAGNKQSEFSAGMTLADLAALMKTLGCNHALNFDGGTSTTMVIRSPDIHGSNSYKMVCGREPETKVKSVLVVESDEPRKPSAP